MICNHCFEEIPDDSQICPICNTPITHSGVKKDGLKRKNKKKSGNRAPLFDESGNITYTDLKTAPQKKRPDKGKLAIILTSVLAVTAVIVGVVVFVNLNKNTDKSMTSRAAAVEQTSEKETVSVKEAAAMSADVHEGSVQSSIEEQGTAESSLVSEAEYTATSFENDTADSYFWPAAYDRLYTYSDLEGLSKEQINMIKAELYARAGMKFKDKKYQDYFSRKSWYSGEVDEDHFNANKRLGYYAIENIRMIETYLSQ